MAAVDQIPCIEDHPNVLGSRKGLTAYMIDIPDPPNVEQGNGKKVD